MPATQINPGPRHSLPLPFGYTRLVINGSSPLGTVLVCDDEDINRALLERLLKKFGYEVLPVSSGDEAVSTLRHRHVDLVLLDVQMPGINGFEVCAYLKQAPETRLIPDRARHRAQRPGAQDPRLAGRRRRLHRKAVRSRGAASQGRVARSTQAVAPTTWTRPKESCAASRS